ncbi:transporter [Odoribacter sp. Z80]|uniref:transporter n=1 Tax=Odoribacter sp. Z80 TaxID=2304575 RepID=UPI00137B8684|nr:transporter [Odoribacter sp. Z80]
MLQTIKTWMLPLAMLSGAFFYEFFQQLSFLTPGLIFSMLFITYCKLSFRDLKFSGLHIWLLMVQLIGCLVVYGGLVWFDPVVAEGGLICVLAPTATAAAVVTGMLGGSVACLAAYTLMSSLVVAVVSPLIFTLLGEHPDMSFWTSILYICRQVMPVLVLPFALALLLERVFPAVHRRLKKLQILSFYLWALGLTIVTGKTVYFIVHQENANVVEEWWMAALALVICIFQFGLGRRIGRRYGDAVSGGQGLGQKNTILAIWMAQVYLNPLSSIAPASYVLWQNIINSYQLWKTRN